MATDSFFGVDLKVKQSRNDFLSRRFFQKTNEGILLYYYETSFRLVFVHFLEEIEDTKKDISKLTDLYLKVRKF